MPTIKEISKPKKGDKIWLMRDDVPVEVTVVKTPMHEGPNGYDGVWTVSMPGVVEDMQLWPRRVFATRKECLAYYIQDKREDIEHDRQFIQRDKEYLKRDEELYAKWFKMLEDEDA